MKKIISYISAFFVIFTITVITVCTEGMSLQNSETIVIEAEGLSFQYASLKNSDEASGSKYIAFDCGIGAANQTINLNVEEAGYYSLDVIAGVAGANSAYSSITIQVNDESVKAVAEGDIDSEKGSFNGYAGLPLKYFKVYDKIYLEQGENPVNITIGARPGYPSQILAQFDAFIINPCDEPTPTPTPTPAGDKVLNEGTSVIEAEGLSFQYASLKNSDEASGSKYIAFDCGIGAANQTINLNVEEAGYYSLDVIAGVAGANSAYSSITVRVNEETVKELTESDIDSSKGSFTGYAGLPLKYFKVYDKVYLTEGENTVKITIGERPGIAGQILAQFDAFIFNPYDESEPTPTPTPTPDPDPEPTPTPTPIPEIPVINGDNYLIEAESQISGYTVVNNEYASGGKVIKFEGTKSDDVSVEFMFDLEEAGEYALSFLAANTLTNRWASEMSVGIGEDIIEMTVADFVISSPDESYIDNDYPVKILRYNKPVTLIAGRNSIVIKVKLRSYGDLAAVLDCIYIQKQKDISGGISAEDIIVREGENADILLKNAAGESLYEYDVDSISVELSEYGIAGAEGLEINAYNRGKTEFTVTVKKNDDIKTAKGNITVVGDAGIYIKELKKESNTVTAKISAVTDYSGGDCLLLAVYGVNNNVKSSLKGTLMTNQLPEISAGESSEIRITIDNIADGDIIVAYITDMTYTKSLYGKSIIK